jgi:putative oxidoreductase
MSPLPVRPDLAATLLRTALGVLFLAHGLLKVLVFTVPGTVQFFTSIGLPGALAYPVIALEVLGGLALIAGVFTRTTALALAAIAFGAVLPHAGNGWVFSNPGGGWEFPVFLGLTSLALALSGPGAYALRPGRARG